MEKREILTSLMDMFDDSKNERAYKIESKQIDKKSYLTLIVDNEDFIPSHPDYESFINLLRYRNTKDLNFVASKLNQNKKKIFLEFTDVEKERFLNDINDMHQKLKDANSKNIVFIEYMITDWVNKLFLNQQIMNNNIKCMGV